MGYARAGFDVIGVDINPQPNYPFEFHQADALTFLAERGVDGVAAIHASPPCQRFSAMSTCRPGLAADYPDLIAPTREVLGRLGVPYVLENVPGSPLRPDATLCGQMFGLALYRHRIFESNAALLSPLHPPHLTPASKAGHWTPGTIMSVSGHIAPIKVAREAMGIDWMNREELAESIPPAYTEWVGARLLTALAEHGRPLWDLFAEEEQASPTPRASTGASRRAGRGAAQAGAALRHRGDLPA